MKNQHYAEHLFADVLRFMEPDEKYVFLKEELTRIEGERRKIIDSFVHTITQEKLDATRELTYKIEILHGMLINIMEQSK